MSAYVPFIPYIVVPLVMFGVGIYLGRLDMRIRALERKRFEEIRRGQDGR